MAEPVFVFVEIHLVGLAPQSFHIHGILVGAVDAFYLEHEEAVVACAVGQEVDVVACGTE